MKKSIEEEKLKVESKMQVPRKLRKICWSISMASVEVLLEYF